MRRARPGLILAFSIAACVCVAWPARARASTEEFSTFSAEAQEEDDESLIDHLLTRPPRAWRDEWERAPQAFRSSQGCLTSGEWFIGNQLRLRSPLGGGARFGLDLDQDEADDLRYQNLDLSLRFPTRWGTPGAFFRPLHDKSRQDFALMWEAGADTVTPEVQLVFTIEDIFNNLWAWRQTRVGNLSEPYERHPYEPALRLLRRGARWRAEIAGKYLTPSRKRVIDDPVAGTFRTTTLWGTHASGSFELEALGFAWELGGWNRQATSTDRPFGSTGEDGESFRRQWLIESALRRAVGLGLEAEARWLYQHRDQSVDPPAGARRLAADDRVLQLELDYAFGPGWSARLGGMRDRATVGTVGAIPFFTYGTRNETRVYVSLAARFGAVSLHAVEGFELDHEPYEVWFVHDKAFVKMQTRF